MTTLFVILIVLASVVLGLIVLVQNPKGGGLAGNVAGFSNQFLGVKQTTGVLEKGIWIPGTTEGLPFLFLTILFPKTAFHKVKEVEAAPTSTSLPRSPRQQESNGILI